MASCYNATHVVVQVEYGADAIFILRKRIDNRNEENKTNDELKICAENLRKVLEGVSVGILQKEAENAMASCATLKAISYFKQVKILTFLK